MNDDRSGLAGKTVLIVEDEYLIAHDLKRSLERDGALVLGPAPTAARALALIHAATTLDAAVLDIKLDVGRDVYPVAEALRARGVPFVFATGYDRVNVRRDFATVPHFDKPFDLDKIGRSLFAVAAG